MLKTLVKTLQELTEAVKTLCELLAFLMGRSIEWEGEEKKNEVD